MANKNTKRRLAAFRKEKKQSGFPKPVFKKRSQPYPRPNKDVDLSIEAQAKMLGRI